MKLKPGFTPIAIILATVLIAASAIVINRKLNLAQFPQNNQRQIDEGFAQLLKKDTSDDSSPLPGQDQQSSQSQPSPSAIPQTAIATPSPSPTPTQKPQQIASCSPHSKANWRVKPYLLYPSDKSFYSEYESAARNYLTQLQDWYCSKVGKTFAMDALKVMSGPDSYSAMRCGSNPSDSCANDVNNQVPFYNDGSSQGSNWWNSINKAVGRQSQNINIVFAVGGGGWAGASDPASDSGLAIVGDWVMEPLSGKVNSWGVPCTKSHGWECTGGTPGGSMAHELGHTFGLNHPSCNECSIMTAHWEYPALGFIDSELNQLRSTAFLNN